MKNSIKPCIALVLCTLALSQWCALLVGGGAGAGAVAYAKGEYRTAYAAPYDKVWNAVLQALRDQQMEVTDRFRDRQQGQIQARKRDGKTLTIKVEDVGEGVSAVKIRVGTMGDEAESKLLERQIAHNLGL